MFFFIFLLYMACPPHQGCLQFLRRLVLRTGGLLGCEDQKDLARDPNHFSKKFLLIQLMSLCLFIAILSLQWFQTSEEKEWNIAGFIVIYYFIYFSRIVVYQYAKEKIQGMLKLNNFLPEGNAAFGKFKTIKNNSLSVYIYIYTHTRTHTHIHTHPICTYTYVYPIYVCREREILCRQIDFIGLYRSLSVYRFYVYIKYNT